VPPISAPPELLIFDVDGTLQDTFLWWPKVIRDGLARFGAANRLVLESPSDELACSVVGMKDEGVWAPFLPEPEKHRWRDLRAMVLPMEVEVMSQGRSFLFAGAKELLVALRGLGKKLALASNCRSVYMAAIKAGQGLGPLTDWQLCLDTPGVTTKADMVGLACELAGTRRAVMVGDRENDQAAARAHGLPFVWRQNTRCTIPDADAIWGGDPLELLRILGLPEYPVQRP
jgi:phosphoglycolate phosphatase-like HAD superfamily hydrolase